MSKKLSGMLVLCVATLWLAGCSYFRATGPCFGVGCPAHTVGQNGQYRPGQAAKAQNASASHATAPSAQAADSAPVTAAPQAAPAQAKTAETKSSSPNKFTEFFAHLIPHHNKTAKPAPAD